MVLTLKDGTVVTLFDPKEAIEIIGQELYDFIVGDKTDVNEKIYEKDVAIDDLECEIASLENTLDSISTLLDDALDDLREYLSNEENQDLKSTFNKIENAYELTL